MLTLRSPAQQVQCPLRVGVNVFGGKRDVNFSHIPLDGMEDGVLFMIICASPSKFVLVPCFAELELNDLELSPFQPVDLALSSEFVVSNHSMYCMLHSLESVVLDTGAETQPLDIMGGGGLGSGETGTQLLDQAAPLPPPPPPPPPPPHTMVVEDDEEDRGSVDSDDLLNNPQPWKKKPKLDLTDTPSPPQLPQPTTLVMTSNKSRLIMGEEEGEKETEMVEVDYGSWKVDRLRQELKQLGLDAKGTKPDLVARLNLHAHRHLQSPPTQDSFTFYRASSMPVTSMPAFKPADRPVEGEVDQPTLILDQHDTGESLPSLPATPSAALPVTPPRTLVAPTTAPSTTATLPLDSATTPATVAAEASSSPVTAVPFNHDQPDELPPSQPLPSYHEMKVAELRQLCEERGLDSKGKKDALIQRLLQSPSVTAVAEALIAMKTPITTPVRILFTSFKPSNKQLKQVQRMGGTVLEEDSVDSPTHVVVLKAEIRRTLKLLFIMTQIGLEAARIVHSDWLVHSLEAGEWSPHPERYFPYEGNTSLEHALHLRDQATHGLLLHQHFLLSKDTKPSFQQLEPIILEAGGKCELLTSSTQLDQPNVVVLGQGELSLDSEMRRRVHELHLTWMKPGWLLNCITSYSLGPGSDADLVISLGNFFHT
ncbi:hypothetical protein BASA81_008300 [Batrachochytrium salamandrivorans]|nr:hypothetical protein BASA81_008300 [Batrachochytrium salamandrivorans]